MLSKELVAASTKPLLLSLLGAGESYGYELIRRMKELSAEEILWTEGMLYPVLHRLEAEGLIAAEWRDAETGRQRKYYRLCHEGRTALKREQAQWATVHETLSKLWQLKPSST